MADFRIKHGLALGPYGTVGQTSGQHLFTAGDTTPDVSLGSFFLTQNTSATVITYFDGLLAGGLLGPEEGKVIVIRFGDNLTTLVPGSQMLLASSGNTMTSGGTISLIHFNSAWTELARTRGATDNYFVPAVTAVAGSFAVNVDRRNFLVLNNSAASAVLVAFSGGDLGQVVNMIPGTSNALQILSLVAGTGNILLANTASFVVNASGVYQFVKVLDNQWRMIKAGAQSVVITVSAGSTITAPI
jgi:hypothetical protein